MAEGTVTQKFTGNAADLEAILTRLEREYEALNRKVADGGKAARTAAREAVAAEKTRKQEAIQGAKESRSVFYATLAELKRLDAAAAKSGEKSADDRVLAAGKAANEITGLSRRSQQTLMQLDREQATSGKAKERIKTKAARDAAKERRVLAKQEGAFDSQVTNWAVGLAGIVGAYASISGGITAALNIQKELIADSDRFGDNLDRNARKFRVQASLNALESKEAQASIERVAIRNAVKVEQAQAGSTQLASGGFSPRDAKGQALEAVLQTMAVTGNAEGDVGDFAKSMTQATAAFGLEKNAENLRRVGQMMAGSYKKGDFQASDMAQLAPKVQGLIAQGQSPEDIMAMYNIMRSVTEADKASTALKGFSEAHAAAVPLPGQKVSRQEKLLKMLKVKDAKTGDLRSLTSAEVDLQGEDFSQIQPLMQEGLGRMTKPQQARWLQEFYGKEYASAVQGLYARGSEFKSLRDAQFNPQEFAADVKVSQSGRAAARVRTDEQMMLEKARLATDETLMYDQFAMEQRKAGATWVGTGASRFLSNTARFFGAGPRSALTFGESMTGNLKTVDQPTKMYDRALRNTYDVLGGEMPVGTSEHDQNLLRATEANTAAIKEQTEAFKKTINTTDGNMSQRDKLRALNEKYGIRRPKAVDANE